MKYSQSLTSLTIFTLVTVIFALTASVTLAQQEGEFGDAPEGSLAYPTLGVMGSFPTCMTVGPAAYIYHFPAPFQFFGPMKDFETDGNAGACPGYMPYDMDECFMDGDAGLMIPGSFTIAAGSVVPCPGSPGGAIGPVCTPAMWGPSLDIFVANLAGEPAYVNVLMDWNQDGIWAPSTQSGCAAPEHILLDFPIPSGYAGPLSALMPPGFLVGGNPGHVWSRFSVTNFPVGIHNWDGAGQFEDGETEDYLLLVDSAVATEDKTWDSLKSYYR